jgi:hypothetical protein
MGTSSSSTRAISRQSEQSHHAANLVLHALPILRDLAKYLLGKFALIDSRWEFLQSFCTASTILSDRLSGIMEQGTISGLAQLLEELLDDQIIRHAQFKVSHLYTADSCYHQGLIPAEIIRRT